MSKLKTFLIKLIAHIDHCIIWITSKDVLDAINNGLPYEEVNKIVLSKSRFK